MRIKNIAIKRFRSIENLSLDFDNLTLLCGPNSSGKSNVLRAIQVALEPDAPREVIYQHTPVSRREGRGKFNMDISIQFTDCPPALYELAGVIPETDLTYRVSISRAGNYTRTLGGRQVSHSDIVPHIDVIYVPPIRDLAAGGISPFRELLAQALRKARGAGNLNAVRQRIASILHQRAHGLLTGHAEFVKRTLGADGLQVDLGNILLDDLYNSVSLAVQDNGQTLPLSDFGTGHQSAVILHLFRQLGESMPGSTVFLFEEPDNHLHPATIRVIGDDLATISVNSQVIATSHSPILIGHVGLRNVRVLGNSNRVTVTRPLNLADRSDSDIRDKLSRFGLRATEPLLAKRIIVCEGSSDVTVLSEIARQRLGRSPDQMDVVITSAGGKGQVAILCEFLASLGADWRAVLDRDASQSSEAPFSKEVTTEAEKEAALAALPAVLAVLNDDRARGLAKSLRSVEAELGGALPRPEAYAGSRLEKILRGHITHNDETALIAHLAGGGRRAFQAVLKRYGVWLWSSDLESALIPDDAAAVLVEQELIRLGELRAPVPAAGRLTAIRKRAKFGEDTEPLRAITSAVIDGNIGREMIECVKFLFEGV